MIEPKKCSFCNNEAVGYTHPDHYCKEHWAQYWEWANNIPTTARLKRVIE